MTRIGLAVLVLLLLAGAARAQLREPSCVTFAGMSEVQREYITLGMLGGFVAATTLAQRIAVGRADDAAQSPGAKLVSDALTGAIGNVKGQTPRTLATKLREACTQGRYLGSPANLALLDLLLAAKPGKVPSVP